MSQENVEVVRSIVSAWERGDFSTSDWAHPEIEFVMADGPTPGSWTGVAEMLGAWRDFLSAWKDFHTTVDECRELDGERVLVLIHRSGRGRASGADLAEMHSEGAQLFHLRGGKVTRFVRYWDRGLAFAELGLASETGGQE